MGLTRIKAGQISDIDYKQAVRVVTITNVSLAGSAPATVDGVSLLSNDRVLVTGQNTASQNGLYRVQTLGTGSNGTWVRTTDANENGEIEAGMIVMVTEGSSYADTLWKLTTNNPIVIDSTGLTFVLNSTGGGGVAGSNTQVQFNDNGSAGASTAFTFNKTANLLAVTGNIQGTYFIGNGSQLTGIAGGSGTAISNGTSNVNIATANANVTFSVNGMANRVVVGSTQTEFAGNVMPAANVTYDLGSSTNRWNDIWLANSTIYIGSANISADGADLVLPANVAIGSATLTAASGNLALPTGTTVGGALVETPRIANVQITTAAWVVKDDTAVSLEGGYIIINGSGFVAGASVVVGSTLAAAATVVNSTTIQVRVNAAAAGTYVVYVANPDGSVGILVPGLTYSGTPTWVTGSTLPNQTTGVAVSVQLDATGATTYSVSAGNTLPEGLSLSSGGLLSGTVTVEAETVYNFSVDAIDAELQDSPRTFSVTVTVGDPYFENVVALMHFDGTNGAQNNTFLDSSTNAFTITRNGNTTQGSFSPFSRADGGWSNYFDGSGDSLGPVGTTSSFNFMHSPTALFTIEAWVYVTTASSQQVIFDNNGGATSNVGVSFFINNTSNQLRLMILRGSSGTTVIDTTFTTTAVPFNAWTHVALTYDQSSSSDNAKLYINGVAAGTATKTGQTPSSSNATSTARVGEFSVYGSGYFNGYISNLRITNSIVYTAAFTPPTSPLTAIANTSLLTCQSNRFKDNSANAFAITPNGNVSVQVFNPFNPTTAYSTTTTGGSGYFDGSGDYLNAGSSSAFAMGTGAYTVEMWVYVPSNANQAFFAVAASGGLICIIDSGTGLAIASRGSAAVSVGGGSVQPNAWNHLVFCRASTASNQTAIFVNGARTALGTDSNNYTITGPAYVGALDIAGYNVTGYISGLRVVKGTAVYDPTQTTLTAPTAPPTNITNTSLLCNFTNAAAFDSAAIEDYETVGSSQLSTAQFKFGTSSLILNGTTSSFQNTLRGATTSANFRLGTGPFTIEGFLRLNSSTTSYPYVWNLYNPGTSTSVLTMFFGDAGFSYNLLIYYNNNLINVNNAASRQSAFLNTWKHFAFVRDSSSTFTVYVDGVSVYSTAAFTADLGSSKLHFGNYGDGSTYGYLDEFRITKGVARYTSNFTPPDAPFQDL